MSTRSYELVDVTGNSWQALQSVQQGLASSGVQPYYCQCHSPRELNDWEIVIEELAPNLPPRLNYGAKLRLLMADPHKGVDLRNAIAALKIALKEAHQNG